jgi:hypothetical protein
MGMHLMRRSSRARDLLGSAAAQRFHREIGRGQKTRCPAIGKLIARARVSRSMPRAPAPPPPLAPLAPLTHRWNHGRPGKQSPGWRFPRDRYEAPRSANLWPLN